MMRKICFVAIIPLCLFACKKNNVVDPMLLSTAEQSIRFCVNEYVRLSGNTLSDEVDKAYVHVSLNRFGVLFVRGEVGTFGKRTSNYKAYLNCDVVASAGLLKIYYLGSFMSDPLIKDPDADTIDHNFYEKKVKELLYKRSGDKFIFVAGQNFVEPVFHSDMPPVLY